MGGCVFDTLLPLEGVVGRVTMGVGGMVTPCSDLELTERIIQCIIKVHQTLGPGFLESIYRNAMLIELRSQGLQTESEVEIVIYYEDQEVGKHRLDLVVENRVIIELKTVTDLGKAQYAQIRSYLRASGLRTGILVNFNKEKADFRRIEVP